MVDTKVSKTFDLNRSCGFESLSWHNIEEGRARLSGLIARSCGFDLLLGYQIKNLLALSKSRFNRGEEGHTRLAIDKFFLLATLKL